MVIRRYDVFLVNLDPTIGHEVRKTRPCPVISPNEYIGTVIIGPMTTMSRDYPTRVRLRFQDRQGWIVLDQVCVVDKKTPVKKLGKMGSRTITSVKSTLSEMLAG